MMENIVMEMKEIFSLPAEVIAAKIRISDLTVELSDIVEEKKARLVTMSDIYEKEGAKIREITEATTFLKGLLNGKK